MKIQIAKNKTIDVDPLPACSPSFCRGCGREIFWAVTKAGKQMPISETPDGKYVSHFSDCPKANNFRKNIK